MPFAFVPARLLKLTAVTVLVLLLLLFRGDNASTKENSVFAPNLSATKTAALDAAGGDANGNGIINPSDRIKYQVVISNAGPDAATGVNFCYIFASCAVAHDNLPGIGIVEPDQCWDAPEQ